MKRILLVFGIFGVAMVSCKKDTLPKPPVKKDSIVVVPLKVDTVEILAEGAFEYFQYTVDCPEWNGGGIFWGPLHGNSSSKVIHTAYLKNLREAVAVEVKLNRPLEKTGRAFIRVNGQIHSFAGGDSPYGNLIVFTKNK